ncbi:hypothetical protein PC116_g10484 [Phytophthora cactorum]|nr:hypothetical protein C6341_g20995 [Phytophthora cactorum]KAG4241574.1 hypothetical protein PC116_g10484 [Phytophthora cactorum]
MHPDDLAPRPSMPDGREQKKMKMLDKTKQSKKNLLPNAKLKAMKTKASANKSKEATVLFTSAALRATFAGWKASKR